jgi:hypothetical protein
MATYVNVSSYLSYAQISPFTLFATLLKGLNIDGPVLTLTETDPEMISEYKFN